MDQPAFQQLKNMRKMVDQLKATVQEQTEKLEEEREERRDIWKRIEVLERRVNS